MHSAQRAGIVGALTLLLSVTGIPVATVASAAPRDCVATVDASPPGSTEAQPVTVSCFDSSTEASASMALTSILVGIEYTSSGYGGSTLSLYGSSGSGCFGGVTYGFSSLPGGWSNVISSAQGFNGCGGRHFDSTGYGGSFIQCSDSCSSMGAMDNRTSSIIFQ
jgi:hypothetical protein